MTKLFNRIKFLTLAFVVYFIYSSHSFAESLPTAKFTVNGLHNVVLQPGDVSTKVWSSTGGTNWSSTYSYSNDTSRGVTCSLDKVTDKWIINTKGGSLEDVISDKTVGCVIKIIYKVSNSVGSVSDTVTITTIAPKTKPTASIAVNNSHNVSLYPGDSYTKKWNSVGATKWSSTYLYGNDSSRGATCALAGTGGVWAVETPSGSSTSIVDKSTAGCIVKVIYTASNAAGSVSDAFTITTIAPKDSIASNLSKDVKSETISVNKQTSSMTKNTASNQTVPNSPKLYSATAGNNSILLKFSTPSNGGSAITGYKAVCGGKKVSGKESPIVVIGLTQGKSYNCVVLAINKNGSSFASNSVRANLQRGDVSNVQAEESLSSAVYITSTTATVPSAPVLYSAVTNNNSVTLTFNSPSNGGSTITSYTAVCGNKKKVGLNSPIVINELNQGTKYACVVLAKNKKGSGPLSNSIIIYP